MTDTDRMDPLQLWPRATWRSMHSQMIGALIIADDDTRRWLLSLTNQQITFEHFLLAAIHDRIRVTVHVHPRGGGDDALSEKRAEEIRKWLVQWGVEPERIEAKGIGSKRPLVAKTKRGADEINDRVEFIILERN